VLDAIENSFVLKTLFQNGLLAVLLLVAGYLFNAMLQRSKLRGEGLNKVMPQRMHAYAELWRKLVKAKPKSPDELTAEECQDLYTVLVDWYHKEAYAMYMSWACMRSYFLLRAELEKTEIDSDEIRKRVSQLRTSMKVDCGVYTSADGRKKLPALPKQSKYVTFKEPN